MALLKIARMGHPVLRRPAEPVADPTAPEIRRLIADMKETMLDLNAAGIAAPQVHVPLRVVMFRVSAARAELEEAAEMPLTVLINPVLEPVSDAMFDNYEGCLSVPDLRGVVRRHAEIRVRAWDREGNEIDRVVRGITAGTFQHECDHLDGKLFVDRVTDTTTLCTWKEFAARHEPIFRERVRDLVARYGS